MWCAWKIVMAGLDRSAWGSSGIVLLSTLIVGGCSTNVQKPLEAPAGTSVSAPQSVPEETPVAEPEETVPLAAEAPVQAKQFHEESKKSARDMGRNFFGSFLLKDSCSICCPALSSMLHT